MKYNYSDVIIKLSVKLSVSQLEFAKVLGASFSFINRCKTGKYAPTIIAKEKLKKLLKDNCIELEEVKGV